MEKEIKVAIVGLDTSHATKFPGYMADPACAPIDKVTGLRPVTCLRFETPFQDKQGLDERQKYLEGLGVKVTEDFDECVKDCDAIMIEINDPNLHLEYFEKCAPLGKPVFLDKPFADTVANSKKIIEIGKKYNTNYFTSAAGRFDTVLNESLAKVDYEIAFCDVWASLGVAPEGRSYIVWYGVHAFEKLNRIMGCGAKKVRTYADKLGYVCNVEYEGDRRAVVELCYNTDNYGALIRGRRQEEMYIPQRPTAKSPASVMMSDFLVPFFHGGKAPVSLKESLEVMAMLEAAEKSAATGKEEIVEQI